jgi:O-acetyl-ADP-ribose deacetylase (regulator of RNase III)
MIEYKRGNVLDVKVGIIVHGCNAQGVMGSGVALAIKQMYYQCFLEYRRVYEEETLPLGSIVWFNPEFCIDFSKNLFIANAITQEYFGTDRRHVNYAAIAKVFMEVFRQAKTTDLEVHFPKIGAGLGGGDWDIIEAIINDCDPQNQVKKVCWVL